MRDLASNLKVVQAIGPIALAADSTLLPIDLLGYNSAMFAIGVGIGGITFTGTNKIEFVMTHSDDGTTFVPVTDDDIQGASGTTNGIVKSLITAHAAADVSKVGYVGGKRWVQLLAYFSGTHGTGTPISVVAVLGSPSVAPVA